VVPPGAELEAAVIDVLRPGFLVLLLSVPATLILHRRLAAGVHRPAAILRAVGLAALVLAASGPRISAPSDRVDAVFVVDASDSMGRRGQDAAISSINAFLSGMTQDDTAGLVTVAEAAAVEESPRPGGAPFAAASRHDGSESNLAEGLYAAAGLLGGDGERRIVVVSDGRDTGGGLDDALRFVRRTGVTVDVLPAGEASGGETRLRELRAPSRILEEEVHELSAVIQADQASAVRLVILRDGESIGEDRRRLPPGVSVLTWEMPGVGPGTVVYEVLMDAAVDRTVEDNRGLAAVEVRGAPRILWAGRGASAVPAALELQGLTVDRVRPGDIPDSMAGLSPWDALILDNVSSRDLSLRTLALLESWVRTRGGGLMMVGGDSSFGLGGYQDTPVERALPVSMDAPSSLYIPSLSMVMVIDKSGSMGGDAGGSSKLDLVKDAVLAAVEVLNPLYTVGLVAFDADVEWTIPITEAGNRRDIQERLSGLTSGGGTVLYPAIRQAYERLVQSPAAVRHLVVLSDGLAEPADFAALADAIARDGITVSTVAVGSDADSELMESLAERGDGRYWYAEDVSQVPQIFASESMIVSQGLVVEETIFPVPADPAEALDGLDLNLLPPVHGYVMTYPDAGAVEALRSPRGHPILVYGRHGLGRSVAFTSDLRGAWGRDWVSWEQFPRFIAQSVRWMRRRPGDSEASLELRPDDDGVGVVLESRDPGGASRTDLRPQATVIDPDQVEGPLPMIQTQPGRYEGRFRPDRDGVYQLIVQDTEADLLRQATWTRAYSPELASAGRDMERLAAIARLGDGRLMTGEEAPRDWWAVRRERRRTVVDLTPFLALAALLLLLMDIAVRESEHWRPLGDRDEPEGAGDPEALILRGLDADRHTPKARRMSPSEAARLLAERRARREGRKDL